MNLSTLGWDGDWAATLADLEDRSLAPARVIAVHRGRVHVCGEQLDALVPVAGALAARASSAADLPTVGDWVAVRGGEVAAHVLPRRTLLVRADDDAAGEPLAANADVCLIATSLNHDLNLRRIERFVALSRAGGIDPLLVCTKGDLVRDPAAEAGRVAAAVGVEALAVSALDGHGMPALRARIQPGRTAALVGMSGVGKSTLVNVLLGEQRQRTLEVRATDDRGRHATTHRELFVLDDGALLIDMPGLRLPRMASPDGVEDTFADVAELAAACRFADCRHASEPGCAVTAAIATGELQPGRLAAMRRLAREGRSAARRHARRR